MIQTTRWRPMQMLLASALLFGTTGCGDGSTDEATVASHTHSGESITIWADSVELFFEHPDGCP